jgi:hypothetical protein
VLWQNIYIRMKNTVQIQANRSFAAMHAARVVVFSGLLLRDLSLIRQGG